MNAAEIVLARDLIELNMLAPAGTSFLSYHRTSSARNDECMLVEAESVLRFQLDLSLDFMIAKNTWVMATNEQ